MSLTTSTIFNIQCAFCFGRPCFKEDYKLTKRTKESKVALHGLNAHWVTDKIIASQRLSTRLIREFNLIDQFNMHKVKCIINLQEPGEHPLCGDGIHEESGFSYFPEDLMKHGIQYYNFFWEDLSIPKPKLMLHCVQVMHSIISAGNAVLVHCHAGLGRTGLTIASYLVYSKVIEDPEQAVAFVRKRRPGSVQTKQQQKFVVAFASFLKSYRRVYASISMKNTMDAEVKQEKKKYLALDQYLTKQSVYLHGAEYKRLRNTPKIIYELCKTLNMLFYFRQDPSTVASQLLKHDRVDTKHVASIKKKINMDEWDIIRREERIDVLMRLLMDWFMQLKEPILPQSFANTVVLFASQQLLKEKQNKQAALNQSVESTTKSTEISHGEHNHHEHASQAATPSIPLPNLLKTIPIRKTGVDLGVFKQKLQPNVVRVIIILARCFGRLAKQISQELLVGVCKHIAVSLMQVTGLDNSSLVRIEAVALLLSEAMIQYETFAAKDAQEKLLEEQLQKLEPCKLHIVQL